MRIVTAKRRLEAYKYALDNFNKTDSTFLCIVLKRWYLYNVDADKSWNGNWVYKAFPEFGNKQPKKLPFKDGSRWFNDNEDGNAKRAALLRKCIAEVKKLIPKTPQP